MGKNGNFPNALTLSALKLKLSFLPRFIKYFLGSTNFTRYGSNLPPFPTIEFPLDLYKLYIFHA